jgi:hypothetical protein
MKLSLTRLILAGLLAGTLLTPTAAYALPVDPGETVAGVADSLPLNPVDLLFHSEAADRPALPVDPLGTAAAVVGTIRGALPVDPLGTAAAVVGTIRGALPVDPVARMPRPATPASSAQPAVNVPPKAACPIIPAVDASPLEIARRMTPLVGENFPGGLICRDGQAR